MLKCPLFSHLCRSSFSSSCVIHMTFRKQPIVVHFPMKPRSYSNQMFSLSARSKEHIHRSHNPLACLHCISTQNMQCVATLVLLGLNCQNFFSLGQTKTTNLSCTFCCFDFNHFLSTYTTSFPFMYVVPFLSAENVALRKPATQSGSTVHYSTADKAVDGNTVDDGHKGLSCAHPGLPLSVDNNLRAKLFGSWFSTHGMIVLGQHPSTPSKKGNAKTLVFVSTEDHLKLYIQTWFSWVCGSIATSFSCVYFLFEDTSTYGGPAPEDHDKPAWWRVDLEQEYDVHHIIIYGRNDARAAHRGRFDANQQYEWHTPQMLPVIRT